MLIPSPHGAPRLPLGHLLGGYLCAHRPLGVPWPQVSARHTQALEVGPSTALLGLWKPLGLGKPGPRCLRAHRVELHHSRGWTSNGGSPLKRPVHTAGMCVIPCLAHARERSWQAHLTQTECNCGGVLNAALHGRVNLMFKAWRRPRSFPGPFPWSGLSSQTLSTCESLLKVWASRVTGSFEGLGRPVSAGAAYN